MVDAVVELLIERLSSLMEEEARLLTGVREEAGYMRNQLRSMNAFLQVAHQSTLQTDPQLKDWVNQVREVAYDTEDLLDKFTIRLAHHPNSGRLRRIFSSVNNLMARHQIASEIQILKSQVKNIGDWHSRYYDPNLPQQNRRTYNWRNVNLLPIEPSLCLGIDEPKQQLVDWLLQEEPKLKCISVVGLGGCGKTTLAYKVYRDAKVKKHFQSHLWLVISESSKPKEILVMMIINLYDGIAQRAPDDLMAMEELSLKSIIATFLEKRRYVIVIDDVWSIWEWEVMLRALPENKCGSRVLLTTRDKNIALKSRVDTDGYIYNIEPLSPEAAWELFCKRTFRGVPLPPHLEEICQSISKKCAGLPLAIVTIAGVLSTKDQDKTDEWKMFDEGLSSELEVNENLEKIKILLSLSYDDLPYHLKISYLYMYIFPGGQIKRMKLIRLWIAEGFVQDSEGMTAEEVAERYLHDLINRNLLRVSKTDLRGRPKVLHIHDVLREVVLSRAIEQRIVTLNTTRSNNLHPMRRLVFHNSEEISQGNRRCFDRLRSLIILEKPTSLTASRLVPILSNCKLLKVLDIRGVQLTVAPNEIFDLIHLRYLSMRGTGLTSLPSKIGRLRDLETLDLKHTHITELPDEILSLGQLRYFLAYSFNHILDNPPFERVKGCKTPVQMGKLASLQKLSYIDASISEMIVELGSLIQLRRLGVVKLRREDGNALCNSVAKLTNLRSLSIHSLNEEEIIDINSFSSAHPLQYLHTLELRGQLDMSPVWIHSLQRLVKLSLGWSKLKEEPLDFLQDLPNLKHLTLDHAFEGEELEFKRRGFQGLKILNLRGLKQLKRVRIKKKSMHELEKLEISDCELMDEVPFGIRRLTNLKRLNIYGTLLATQFQDKKREHEKYREIAHISRVFYRTINQTEVELL